MESWRNLFPNVLFQGRDGFFSWSTENESVLREISEFKPDILFVCLGMPLQEEWSLRFGEQTQAKFIIPAGGLLDYYAGKTKLTPRWIGRLGFEWLYRFLHDPRRLFFRYFIEPWFLIPYIFQDILECITRRFPSKGSKP